MFSSIFFSYLQGEDGCGWDASWSEEKVEGRGVRRGDFRGNFILLNWNYILCMQIWHIYIFIDKERERESSNDLYSTLKSKQGSFGVLGIM